MDTNQNSKIICSTIVLTIAYIFSLFLAGMYFLNAYDLSRLMETVICLLLFVFGIILCVALYKENTNSVRKRLMMLLVIQILILIALCWCAWAYYRADSFNVEYLGWDSQIAVKSYETARAVTERMIFGGIAFVLLLLCNLKKAIESKARTVMLYISLGLILCAVLFVNEINEFNNPMYSLYALGSWLLSFELGKPLFAKTTLENLKTKFGNKQENKAVDKIEELKKLKTLLDSGAITQEEFDAKKKQILGL